MYNQNRNRKSDPKSTIISLLVVALFLLPVQITAILVIVALIAVPVFLVIRASLKKKGSRQAQSPDDCPKPLFCFHKDKGEHHLRTGREIDPWDRPDIDISKYQRK